MNRLQFFLVLIGLAAAGCGQDERMLPAQCTAEVLIVGTAGGDIYRPAFKFEGGEIFRSQEAGTIVVRTDRPDTLHWEPQNLDGQKFSFCDLVQSFPDALTAGNQRTDCIPIVPDASCPFVRRNTGGGELLRWTYVDEIYGDTVDQYFIGVERLLSRLRE